MLEKFDWLLMAGGAIFGAVIVLIVIATTDVSFTASQVVKTLAIMLPILLLFGRKRNR